ncbi:MAG: hypothetical protein EZS28_023285 [Streblomastix strix]|uniref:Uncharacterized protein n=1 Tax=Streblomastix strix TaxID=222440 RepID=A0A5J4VFL9_9EUKA|nr:MAG: hypothetical protein EZS28_023285 [Streblomastix strix]
MDNNSEIEMLRKENEYLKKLIIKLTKEKSVLIERVEDIELEFRILKNKYEGPEQSHSAVVLTQCLPYGHSFMDYELFKFSEFSPQGYIEESLGKGSVK